MNAHLYHKAVAAEDIYIFFKRLDEIGIDEFGLDKMVVDETGINKSG